MPDVAPETIAPNLIVGLILITIGILVILNRRGLFRAIARNIETVARSSGKAVIRASSPFWVGFAGAGAMMIGLVMLTGSAIGIVQLAA